MSIRIEITRRIGEERLFCLQPKMSPLARHTRALFVTPELNELLIGPWQTSAQEVRWNRVKADLDHFMENGLINRGYMKPLRKRSDEIWEIRSREPNPSIRIFGRFAEVDVFVATNWQYRWYLELFDEWRRHKRRCLAVWRHDDW